MRGILILLRGKVMGDAAAGTRQPRAPKLACARDLTVIYPRHAPLQA